MRRRTLWIISLALATAGPLHAKTFTRTPLAPELGLDVLTRNVTRERVGRDLFSSPYATVTIAHVDVYDRFPYVEARNFQVVSDPRWNRLVFGEAGRSLRAYDGRTSALGPFKDPRGLADDEHHRIYVADTGNDRVVVLRASTEHGEIELEPLFAIPGLAQPHDVAFSDAGTPFEPADDLLFVAETGRNRVTAVRLEPTGARVVATLGDLGSGPGRFAGPMAIAVGRSGAANTADVYVADAHNRRIVHLKHERGALQWVAEARHAEEVVTSLDSDAWGNLYAAAPHQGVVRKLNSKLVPVAELRTELARPKGFHVPFASVRDHRDGSVKRVGQPSAVSVDQWSSESGMKLFNLGVEVAQLGVAGDEPAASFTLTDQAVVTLESRDAATGRALGRRVVGALGAGRHTLPLGAGLSAGAGNVVLRLTAVSSYAGGGSDVAEASFAGEGVALLPAQPMLLGNSPNPASASTEIRFALPETHGDKVSLRVYDANGRRIRSFDRGFSPGLNQVVWNGADERGRPVGAGVYFYRLEVGTLRFTRSMVLVR